MRHALGEVRIKCGAKDMTDDDVKAQVVVYARDLVSQYAVPDILTVLRRWPDEHLWWPKWAELKPLMDERAAYSRSCQLLENPTRQNSTVVACVDVALTSRRCMCPPCKHVRRQHVREVGKTCGCWVCQRADEWDTTPKPNPDFREMKS